MTVLLKCRVPRLWYAYRPEQIEAMKAAINDIGQGCRHPLLLTVRRRGDSDLDLYLSRPA